MEEAEWKEENQKNEAMEKSAIENRKLSYS